MAYDGLVVAATIKEMKLSLLGGKIARIIQSERDEVELSIHSRGRSNLFLKLSASPSLPMLCLEDTMKTAPLTAPSFCMMLRKQIGNGTIREIYQASGNWRERGLERVVIFAIEHLNELGDPGIRYLSMELMGKYSNLILLKGDGTILDSLRHVSSSQSSVRETLPGRPYFIPAQEGKKNPLTLSQEEFSELFSSEEALGKLLFHHLTGFSYPLSQELCSRVSLDPDAAVSVDDRASIQKLYLGMLELLSPIEDEGRSFTPSLLYEGGKPRDFAALPFSSYQGNALFSEKHFPSMSELLRHYYQEKEVMNRMGQKSADLRRLLSTLIERSGKKLHLQEMQLRDTEKKDSFRLYGELLNTYGYSLRGGERSFRCINYHNNQEITIPLDPTLSVRENARRFFSRYEKLKRTEENVTVQLEESRKELSHLLSIQTAVSMAREEGDLREIRQEMEDFSYLKRSHGKREKIREKDKAKPYHFLSSDGYEIYVGRNNYQNEAVTFQIGNGTDLWFHVKNVPGSHVIVRTEGRDFESIPDRVFLEAAELAAYFSSKRESQKVEVDYTLRRNLKKVPNAAPGFVIYHTNYSVTVSPGLRLQEIR